MDFFHCQSLDSARELIRNTLAGVAVGIETVALAESLGRSAAQNIISVEDVPPFSRSTVDGYAVQSSDTFGASESNPVWLTVTGEIFMGQEAGRPLQTGQAVAIPTGGMLPAGADSVVMVEHTEKDVLGSSVFVHRPAAPGDNIIAKGEDISGGALVVPEGKIITVAEIGVLAACGFERIPVFRQLEAAVISTGDELVDVSMAPVNGQVRDINSHTLAAALRSAGCRAHCLGIVRDQYEDILKTLREAVGQYPLVLISGGSSVGARDHTVNAIEALGKPGVLFHGVAVKPGKPTIFGLIGDTAVFGLPGHPVSALTIFDQIVRPVIDRLSGSNPLKRPGCRARLARNIASAPGRDDFIRVRLIRQGQEIVAEPILGKSGLISTLLQADGVVRIETAKSGLYKDEIVEIQGT